MKNHDLEYISTAYGVPAKKEQRVEYTPTKGASKTGRIVGARGHYLRLHFDGEPKKHNGVFHPTDGIRYLS
ncbi:MAG: hypothetical protein ACRDAM_18960 [Casimicrobium sp.]